MTSDRKVEANRRNAQRSTGPRSTVGKRRSSGNARRHGLSAASRYVGYTEADVIALADAMAGHDANAVVKSFARDAAHAHLRLKRIAHYKVALIERTRVFGTAGRPPVPPFARANIILFQLRAWAATGLFLKPPDPEATMPADEEDRSREAIRRALPGLLRLDRYERQAMASRNRALKGLFEAMTNGDR